jgi:hypothetical protein
MRAAAAPPAPLSGGPVTVVICQGPVDIAAWRGVVGPALARPLAAADVTGVDVKGAAACPSLIRVETACVAGVYDEAGRVVTCAPQSLLMLTRAAAWYALARRSNESYESLRLRTADPIDETAFHFADGQTPDTALEPLVSSLPHSEVTPARDEAGRTFLMTLDLVFAAVFGHEDGHLYEQAPFCGVAAPSRVEASGLYAVLLRVESSGELFKVGDLSPEEYRADRCATRRLREAIDRYTRQTPAAEQGDLVFARRAAADIVSFARLIHDPSPHPRPDTTAVPGYLYPALRMLALAGELDATDKPRLCGGAAEAFVVAIQADYRGYPGNGILPDDLQAALPKGVADAWNRKAQWSPTSYTCEGDG